MGVVYKGCVRDGWQHTELIYEYRGYEYMVTKHNNGYMGTPLRKQHEEAQAEIDYKIAHQNDMPAEWQYEGSAQEGFDIFWDYVEGGLC